MMQLPQSSVGRPASSAGLGTFTPSTVADAAALKAKLAKAQWGLSPVYVTVSASCDEAKRRRLRLTVPYASRWEPLLDGYLFCCLFPGRGLWMTHPDLEAELRKEICWRLVADRLDHLAVEVEENHGMLELHTKSRLSISAVLLDLAGIKDMAMLGQSDWWLTLRPQPAARTCR